MKKIFILVLSAAAALVSCEKAQITAPVNDQARIVRFNVTNTYNFQTKSAIAAESHVAIYAGAPINLLNQDYVVSAMPTAEPAAAGTLSGSAIKWGIEQIGTTTDTKFFAMYPYANADERNAFDATHPLAYSIDASDESEEYAKDFLVDVQDQNPGTDVENPNAVSFTLHHPFAILRYAITNSSDDAIRKVEVYGVHKSGTLAYATAEITASGDAVSSENPRNMPRESVAGNVSTYYSVIIPEENINPTIKITTWGGETCTFSLSEAQDFVAGKTYTASLTYSKTHSATTSNRNFTATFNVTDWSAAPNPTAGAQSNNTDNTANWPFVRGAGVGTSWDEGLAMSCVGENSYRLVVTATAGAEFKVFKSADNTWLGKTGDAESTDGWAHWYTGGDNVPISEAGTYTIYYYSDNNGIWVKSGNVTR